MGVEFGKPLTVTTTPVPGLLVIDLPVHGDSRGWFKENWQREKMTSAAIGLPDFGPVQNNVSYNDAVGTTRGIHAEPWDKYVSVATGRVFGAWVDLRAGESFGTVFTAELDPSRAVFVPRGVGNAFQTLEAGTAYSYLVNEHWSASATYTFLNLADETASIAWPIALERSEISLKDREHPRLADVVPMTSRPILVLGADGQLGRALRREFEDDPSVEYTTRADVDLAEGDLATARPWRSYRAIINAAAYTQVDRAETPEGRASAWAANVTGVAALARVAAAHGVTLVHVSSDYVFDGTERGPYRESAPLTPLGVYGQTKAAGDAVVSAVPRHYVVRTSWVIGDGGNFVRTMAGLAARGVDPVVVADQIGRPTFTSTLSHAIRRLLDTNAPFGTYNVTNEGRVVTWYDIARRVFELTGHDPARVKPSTTTDYFASSQEPVSPRPANSELALEKVRNAGIVPSDWEDELPRYLRRRHSADA